MAIRIKAGKTLKSTIKKHGMTEVAFIKAARQKGYSLVSNQATYVELIKDTIPSKVKKIILSLDTVIHDAHYEVLARILLPKDNARQSGKNAMQRIFKTVKGRTLSSELTNVANKRSTLSHADREILGVLCYKCQLNK